MPNELCFPGYAKLPMAASCREDNTSPLMHAVICIDVEDVTLLFDGRGFFEFEFNAHIRYLGKEVVRELFAGNRGDGGVIFQPWA